MSGETGHDNGWQHTVSVAYRLVVQPAGSHLRRIKHPAPRVLADRLTSFDTKRRLERFSKTNYSCEVCLSSIKGAKCISLACEHVFCRACLVDFWGLCISEGDVDRVGCPDPGCVTEGSKASEEDVRGVVSSTEVERWKWLKDKKELEKGALVAETLLGPNIDLQIRPSFTVRWISVSIR